MFSIRVKKLFEPIDFRKKADGFLLFLKAFTGETDLLSNARWFYGKRMQNWKGKYVFNWKLIKEKRNVVWGR